MPVIDHIQQDWMYCTGYWPKIVFDACITLNSVIHKGLVAISVPSEKEFSKFGKLLLRQWQTSHVSVSQLITITSS